jgi:hypothetical protein
VHNKTFTLFGGSIVADVFMAVVEEMLVVIITLVLGFKLDRISASASAEGEIMTRKESSVNGHELPRSKDGIYAGVSSV